MKPAAQRDLRILTEIADRADVTQRALSKSLGAALGLTNLCLKRLVHKGYIKITTIPSNRVKYLLTPKGFAAKTRLTYEYMAYSVALYAASRRLLHDALAPLVADGHKRFALYGTGEAAELAYLTLRETGVEPVAVYADGGGSTFLGLPVLGREELAGVEVNRVIVASFTPPGDEELAALRRLVPEERLLFVYRGNPGVVERK